MLIPGAGKAKARANFLAEIPGLRIRGLTSSDRVAFMPTVAGVVHWTTTDGRERRRIAPAVQLFVLRRAGADLSPV